MIMAQKCGAKSWDIASKNARIFQRQKRNRVSGKSLKNLDAYKFKKITGGAYYGYKTWL